MMQDIKKSCIKCFRRSIPQILRWICFLCESYPPCLWTSMSVWSSHQDPQEWLHCQGWAKIYDRRCMAIRI